MLKIKIDDDSLMDKDNAKMTCLEHERDWFRAEAQRLDNIQKGFPLNSLSNFFQIKP